MRRHKTKLIFLLSGYFLLACSVPASLIWQPYSETQQQPTSTSLPLAPVLEISITNTPLTCTVTASALNMRTGPGTSFSVLTWLTSGQTLIVLEPGAWLKVQTMDGQEGYVHSKYCGE